DYVLSNMPLPILQKIPANFSPDFKAAVDAGRFDAACKVGWQANTRFWENNENQIYGGISYIEAPITQIWYPSYQYFEPKGTLTGVYNYLPQADAIGALVLDERLRQHRAQAAHLHPEVNDPDVVPEQKGL